MTSNKNADNSSKRYMPLSSLKVHTKVDVYGVVKFFKQPYKTRGSDYCTMVSIVDQSYKDPLDKLKCMLFAKEMSKLPQVKLGHIIRFHRLSISEFAGSLQGQNSPGFSWVMFSGEVGDPLEPLKSSSASYSITDTDREKVKELRRWASNKDELHEKLCSFNEVAVGSFFDIVCQVVQISVIETDVGRLLKVWDGTQCIYDVRNVSADCEEQDVKKDDKLIQNAKGFVCDVCVFDDHFRTSRIIKPGDYVKFINLHAAEYKCANSRDDKQAVVEFVLHRGDSFGRSVKVVNPNSDDLVTMKQRQEIVAMENDSFSCTESQTMLPQSSNVQNCILPSVSGVTVNICKENIKNLVPHTEPTEIDRTVRGEHSSNSTDDNKRHVSELADKQSVKVLKRTDESKTSGEKSESCPSLSEPRCMSKSSTVVLNHPNSERSKIKEVLEHAVPYKFRVRVKVYDYHPKANTLKSFLNLYCSVCHYLCPYMATDDGGRRYSYSMTKTENSKIHNLRLESQLQIGSTFKGVPHYNCPQCFQNQDSFHGLDSPPHLQYIYMMRFILEDNSGMLMANIWKEDAVQFFQELEPEDLLTEESSFEHIKDFLARVCPLDISVAERPWLECCIKSYSVTEGTGYQIFDTVIV